MSSVSLPDTFAPENQIYLLMKPYKNKSRDNFINNISATCFGFVSHLQAEYTIAVWIMYYNAVCGFDKISSYVTMEYYKK